MSTAILFHNVYKSFNSNRAIEGLSFEFPEGAVVSLLGPNGAGKTTAISMMLGLIRPSSGTVRLLGRDPSNPAHRKCIGAMLQQVGLPPQLSVQEVLNLFRSFYPEPLPLKQLLETGDLIDLARQQAVKLSGGQKRRLQFAIAMAGNPRVLFLDEPTTAMDVASRRKFWSQLRAFAEDDRRTIVLSTHHLEEADAISDRIIVLQHGKVVADGSPAELKQLAGKSVVSFVAGAAVTDNAIRCLPGVQDIQWSGRHARVRTADSDLFLRALIGSGLPASDFRVSSGALEDAFVAFTESEQGVF